MIYYSKVVISINKKTHNEQGRFCLPALTLTQQQQQQHSLATCEALLERHLHFVVKIL